MKLGDAHPICNHGARVRWYLSRGSGAEGPFDEPVVAQWWRDRVITDAAVCSEGGTSWTPIAQTPPFSQQARVAAPIPPTPMPTLQYGYGAPPIMDGPVPSLGPPSSGDPSLVPAPWATSERGPALGQTQRMESEDVQDDHAWRDGPSVVDRIGRRTPSQIPPSGTPEIAAIEAPRGHRTPSTPLAAVNFSGPLPESAPAWMHHAQRMMAGLADALREGNVDPATEASIERAWAGWELDGSTERQIARLALLVEQTHTAVRSMPPHELERAFRDCGEVLRQGMPKHARRKRPLDEVVQAVREVHREADAWIAVVNATSRLLGWNGLAVAHAAQAVRVAIQRTRPK